MDNESIGWGGDGNKVVGELVGQETRGKMEKRDEREDAEYAPNGGSEDQ
jgi:hypothetical protein